MFQSDEEIERLTMETEAREWDFYERQRLEAIANEESEARVDAVTRRVERIWAQAQKAERERIIKILLGFEAYDVIFENDGVSESLLKGLVNLITAGIE